MHRYSCNLPIEITPKTEYNIIKLKSERNTDKAEQFYSLIAE